MLAQLQTQLNELYQVDTGYRIDDFLITDPALAQILGAHSLLADTQETVLVSEDEDGMSMSVFLDEDMLERLAAGDPLSSLAPSHLEDFWTALEGVSHFTYLAYCAARDKPVTLLELELQAEVDKFITSWLLAHEQDEPELAQRLHGWLFDDVRFHPDLAGEQLERYRAANDYAARFCAGIRKRMQETGDDCVEELRHFYRLTQTHKIGHIHSQAWRPN